MACAEGYVLSYARLGGFHLIRVHRR